MNRLFTQKSFLFFALISLSGCVTGKSKFDAQSYRAEDLLDAVCSVGRTVEEAKGDAWLKVHSKEFSGQFNAHVLATQPDHLKLELVNPLGGTEAVLSVDSHRLEIKGLRMGKKKKESIHKTWAGIPLEWASHLFIGKLPCPNRKELSSLRIEKNGTLVAEKKAHHHGDGMERFIYRFAETKMGAWPTSLHWEKTGSHTSVLDIQLEKPEDVSGSPQRWEASSSRGYLKVRWKQRDKKLKK